MQLIDQLKECFIELEIMLEDLLIVYVDMQIEVSKSTKEPLERLENSLIKFGQNLRKNDNKRTSSQQYISFTTFISTLSRHYNTIIDHEAVERLRIQVFTKLKIKKLGITATYWKNMKPCSNSILQNVRQFKKNRQKL